MKSAWGQDSSEERRDTSVEMSPDASVVDRNTSKKLCYNVINQYKQQFADTCVDFKINSGV